MLVFIVYNGRMRRKSQSLGMESLTEGILHASTSLLPSSQETQRHTFTHNENNSEQATEA